MDDYVLFAEIKRGCNPEAGATDAAYGYMQVDKSIWDSYAPEGSHYHNDYAELKEYAVTQGADFTKRESSYANITVGVAVYAEYSSYPEWGNDMIQVVQHYGEGSKRNKGGSTKRYPVLVSSTSEILYFRDLLAQQKGQNTWYFDILYTRDGKHLVTNVNPNTGEIY